MSCGAAIKRGEDNEDEDMEGNHQHGVTDPAKPRRHSSYGRVEIANFAPSTAEPSRVRSHPETVTPDDLFGAGLSPAH